MVSGRAEDGTAYDLSGPDGAPAVVLIHGLGLNRACWQWLVADLAQRYRVLAYDLLGHGESDPPPPDPVLKTLAEQLARLLEHLALDRKIRAQLGDLHHVDHLEQLFHDLIERGRLDVDHDREAAEPVVVGWGDSQRDDVVASAGQQVGDPGQHPGLVLDQHHNRAVLRLTVLDGVGAHCAAPSEVSPR